MKLAGYYYFKSTNHFYLNIFEFCDYLSLFVIP